MGCGQSSKLQPVVEVLPRQIWKPACLPFFSSLLLPLPLCPIEKLTSLRGYFDSNVGNPTLERHDSQMLAEEMSRSQTKAQRGMGSIPEPSSLRVLSYSLH